MNQKVREIAEELEANPSLQQLMEAAIELSHEGRGDLIKCVTNFLEASNKERRG